MFGLPMTPSPADLLDTIEARQAQRRQQAEKATQGAWKLWGMQVFADPVGDSNLDTAVLVAHTSGDVNGSPRTFNAALIAAHDPQWVLDDVEVKLGIARRAAAQAERHGEAPGNWCRCCAAHDPVTKELRLGWPCRDYADALATLTDLAAT